MPQHNASINRERLQSHGEPAAVLVREGGTDVQPEILLALRLMTV